MLPLHQSGVEGAYASSVGTGRERQPRREPRDPEDNLDEELRAAGKTGEVPTDPTTDQGPRSRYCSRGERRERKEKQREALQQSPKTEPQISLFQHQNGSNYPFRQLLSAPCSKTKKLDYSRIFRQPNSISSDDDGRAQMARLTIVRALLPHFTSRELRHGPFLL